MKYSIRNRGVCSARVDFELDNGIVRGVSFVGGCSGNLQGVGKLAEGRDARELVQILKGIRCGSKNTSCPDQLARAIETALEEENQKEKASGQ